MKSVLMSLVLLTGFTAMAKSSLEKLEHKHISCLVNTAKRTYSKTTCDKKINFDATNEKIKKACDNLITKSFSAPKSQNELNLQRDFREMTVSKASKHYAILSSEVQLVRRDCAYANTFRDEMRRNNSKVKFSSEGVH